MGGPHVTEESDEALGRNGGPRHADAVALGEADETWPKIVADPHAARSRKSTPLWMTSARSANRPPAISLDPVGQNGSRPIQLGSEMAKRSLQRIGEGWGTFRIIPIESGRGCPYGCEFCTVTGFFGDAIRFRTNEKRGE